MLFQYFVFYPSVLFFWLESANGSHEYRIGILHNTESMAWHNARHAIDEWNNAYTLSTGIILNLVVPGDSFGTADDRMCDLMQSKVIVIIVSIDGEKFDETLLSFAMCNRYQIPCISTTSISSVGSSKFFFSITPRIGMFGQATSRLISNLSWNSFILIYQDTHDLQEVSDLLSIWHNSRGTKIILKVIKLPDDPSHYEIFLKYVRERLKQTNLVVHTRDVGTIHALLSAASSLNMTESRYSYMFTNPDLTLLDDFFQSIGKIYKCNITGFQLVHHDSMMKASLALTMDTVTVVGTALKSLHDQGNMPVPEAILCEAEDTWVDGSLFAEAIKQVTFDKGTTGVIRFDDQGQRLNISLKGITWTNERFQKLGIFEESTASWTFESAYLSKSEFPSNMSRVNLAGQKLRVVVYLEEPFVMKVKDGIGYDGFCIDLLIEMSKLLNFTFEIIEVEDGAYGIEDETGQYNGIIGILQRHEADLSVSAVTITYSRVSVIDFTLPFMHLGIAILMGRNNEETLNGKTASETLFTFMEPYSFSVWTLLALSYISVGSIMWLLARFSPYEWFEELGNQNSDNHQNQFNLLDALWFAIGSLMQQGSDVIPRAAATRTVAVFWWMFTLICISSYTAKLAAFLTVERMNTPIESAADLATQQKIKFGTLKNGSTMDFFKEAKIPIYERMWSIMESQTPTVFVNSSREAIARVKAGNYAYMMESTMLEYYMKTDCELQTTGGLLDSKGYGVAVPKGSPLRDVLSNTVLQLQERTILEALKNKWWNGDQENRNCPTIKTKESSVHQVFGIFYVLLTGIIIALLTAFGEFCIESKNRSIRLDLTIPGKLFNWWHMRKFKREAANNGDRNNNIIAITGLERFNESHRTAGRLSPAMNHISADQNHPYLFDEQRENPISGIETTAAQMTERRRNEYKQISRLILPRDEALINRRYSVMY